MTYFVKITFRMYQCNIEKLAINIKAKIDKARVALKNVLKFTKDSSLFCQILYSNCVLLFERFGEFRDSVINLGWK